MKLSTELTHWANHADISDEGKKQHQEMADQAERLETVTRAAKRRRKGGAWLGHKLTDALIALEEQDA